MQLNEKKKQAYGAAALTTTNTKKENLKHRRKISKRKSNVKYLQIANKILIHGNWNK